MTEFSKTTLPKALLALLGVILAGPLPAQTRPTTPGAASPGAAPPPFEIAKVRDNVWYGRFGATNCAWIDMGDGVLVIDTGATRNDAGNLISQIKDTTKGKPIKWFVLTHLHGDSNNGLGRFLPNEATIFVHARVARGVADGLKREAKSGKTPYVVGVGGSAFVTANERTVEVVTTGSAAHTDHDLFARYQDRDGGVLFAGDLITTGRCPMLSDGASDLRGWLAALDQLEATHAAVLVPTRGDASTLLDTAASATRNYLRRLQTVLADFKAKNLPEAQVSSQLTLIPARDCPKDLDSINALSIYRRLQPDGTTRSPTGRSAGEVRGD